MNIIEALEANKTKKVYLKDDSGDFYNPGMLINKSYLPAYYVLGVWETEEPKDPFKKMDEAVMAIQNNPKLKVVKILVPIEEACKFFPVNYKSQVSNIARVSLRHSGFIDASVCDILDYQYIVEYNDN
jgi:hypothetical protein